MDQLPSAVVTVPPMTSVPDAAVSTPWATPSPATSPSGGSATFSRCAERSSGPSAAQMNDALEKFIEIARSVIAVDWQAPAVC
ncbi:hypothetical protein [Streptomyces vinaceus]|uniref:hypothetical protein n=1 Tax=Streptomyces vinaceus TaxID=1960 RepID=UPI00123E48B6|nr:hypothetical protein [Streptomyces vinaceus]